MGKGTFVVYARKSPGETAGTSINYQYEWGVAEGERQGLTLAEGLGSSYKDGRLSARRAGAYVDEGAHGARLRIRGGLWKMLVDAIAGNFDAVVVFRGDRLSRSKDAKTYIVRALTQHGVRIVAGDNPAGDELVEGITGVLGERERALISERTKASLAQVRKEKRLGRPPKGFVHDGLGWAPCRDADSLYALSSSGVSIPDLLRTSEAIALGVRSVAGANRFLANMRAYEKGGLEQHLAAGRPKREAWRERADRQDAEEERALLHQLIDLVPDIRKA